MSAYPYNYDSNGFIVSALTPPGGGNAYQPPAGTRPLPSATLPASGGPNFFGPNHSALTQMLQSALMRQAGAPQQAAAMTANPALAQILGGLRGSSYTPSLPAYKGVDFSPNYGSNGLLTNAGWGGSISPQTIQGQGASGGFLGGGGL